ncbi:MAG: glucose-6-phosphate dehydrogenase assembly protein OpcA [Candidatus Obscuribacterales bacterium]|nr:glucose-6-phosphate dehydrogenase assembly protein OpcA [Candidatus Obscuribacterales bacterium]
MKPRVEEFLSGKVKAVDVAHLESELRSLWSQAERTEGNGDTQSNILRACAMNLVLFSTDEDAEFAAGNLLDEVIVSHPCRALLAIQRDRDVQNLEAWVSARCHAASKSGMKQICCEQITVRYEGRDPNVLPSSVSPLLVADLPVFLWWRTPEINSTALTPFLKSIDRLVVDSRRTTSVSNYLQELLEIVRGARDVITVSDLNWRRLLPWRRAVAEIFTVGSFGFEPSDVEKIKRVEVEFQPRKDGCLSAQILLYIGWLAGRLGWNVVGEKADNSNWKFKANGCEISVTAVDHAEMPPGALNKVKLTLSGDRTITIIAKPKEELVSVVIDFDSKTKSFELLTPSAGFRESDLMGRELETLAEDDIFFQALEFASLASCTFK